jgi:hypothetical protein
MHQKLIVAALFASLSLLGADETKAPSKKDPSDKETKGRIATRKDRQQERIGQGVQSGSMTAAEAARIEAREANLNKKIRKDRRDGKGLTAKEKAKIETRQDRISEDIYKQKHDKQKQK